MKEEAKNISYLKKDLLRLGIVSGGLIILLIIVYILDNKFGFLGALAKKITSQFIQ